MTFFIWINMYRVVLSEESFIFICTLLTSAWFLQINYNAVLKKNPECCLIVEVFHCMVKAISKEAREGEKQNEKKLMKWALRVKETFFFNNCSNEKDFKWKKTKPCFTSYIFFLLIFKMIFLVLKNVFSFIKLLKMFLL